MKRRLRWLRLSAMDLALLASLLLTLACLGLCVGALAEGL